MNPLVAPEQTHRAHRCALSVNVNKVALLRNTRHLGVPSVVHASELCLQAGAQGITVHPRPDERHVRADDVAPLRALIARWPAAEFNIEGNPFHNLMAFIRDVRPHQATFVPDSENQFTSDHGWDLDRDAGRLRAAVEEARSLGVRVSLFMDPTPHAMAQARSLGADRVELYTEAYARAHGTPEQAAVLERFARSADAALAAGLGVNAGHDLSLANLTEFVRGVPGLAEVSIGHALVADALEFGLGETVRRYLRAIYDADAAGQGESGVGAGR
ncbi:MAG: pyridoxine 5'-phosphate synthase [Burkholderiaceae bacterium]